MKWTSSEYEKRRLLIHLKVLFVCALKHNQHTVKKLEYHM